MVVLMCVAVLSFVDSFFIPSSTKLDPGSSGEAMLLMVLGIRAGSRRELPTPVMLMGICLALIASLVNHQVLKSHDRLWTTLMFVLLIAVVFWGRRLKPSEMPEPVRADEKSILKLPAKM